jgi:hypothetical protein
VVGKVEIVEPVVVVVARVVMLVPVRTCINRIAVTMAKGPGSNPFTAHILQVEEEQEAQEALVATQVEVVPRGLLQHEEVEEVLARISQVLVLPDLQTGHVYPFLAGLVTEAWMGEAKAVLIITLGNQGIPVTLGQVEVEVQVIQEHQVEAVVVVQQALALVLNQEHLEPLGQLLRTPVHQSPQGELIQYR